MSRPLAVAAFALVLALLGWSCGGGSSLPKMQGLALGDDGAPLARVPISLEHWSGVDCQEFRSAREVSTDGTGTYRFELTPDEQLWLASPFMPTADCLALRLDRDAGVWTWSVLFSSDAGVPLSTGPTLREWGAEAKVVSASPVLSLSYDDSTLPISSSDGVPGGFDVPPGASLWLEDLDGGVIWAPGAHPTPSLTVAAKVLEDFRSPRARVLAWRTGASGPLAWQTSYSGHAFGLTAGVAAPSRGIACAYVDAGPGPCALTDGSLDAVSLYESPEASFFWPVPTPVSSVALRGIGFLPTALLAGDRVMVDAPSDAGSADGGWLTVGSATAFDTFDDYLWLNLTPVTTRQLRVRVVGSDGSLEPLLGMNEASFW